jgi:uncharacterized membrane protein YjjP (DUF1212 family)
LKNQEISRPPVWANGNMNGAGLPTTLLLEAGRLLLEYNESTAEIHRTLMATARALSDKRCRVAVTYRGITVSLGEESPVMEAVNEFRPNMAVQARVHRILERLRTGAIDPAGALASLRVVEQETPRHPRWLSVPLLGAGAASLAILLGADTAAAVVAGLATALGLIARQELGQRGFSMLWLPLTATLVGAILGGIAIRLGWTSTPGLALVVPALMVMPGPHLINGLLDLIDNHMLMGGARLALALCVILASGIGVAVGIELIFTDPPALGSAGTIRSLNVVADVCLAGVVACSFAVVFNTPWREVWMATLGGMAGHGLRFLAQVEAGCRLDAATFLGGLAVGAMAGVLARYRRMPLAVVAFAGAVTMVPGLQFYRALAGALQVARGTETVDASLVTGTVTNALQGTWVVGALTLGLILGARAVSTVFGREREPSAAKPDQESVFSARVEVPQENSNTDSQALAPGLESETRVKP